MKMLIDWHTFEFHASVPWPHVSNNSEILWSNGVREIECWLSQRVGERYVTWAWTNSQHNYHIGVAFRWDQDRLMFVTTWTS